MAKTKNTAEKKAAPKKEFGTEKVMTLLKFNYA